MQYIILRHPATNRQLTLGVTALSTPPNTQGVREMSDDARLKALEARIDAAKAEAEAEPPRADEHYSMANVAWRMVIELVAGLGLGFGIGYGLDALLGTTPFLMILFIGFGFAAGVNVMMRTAREVQEKQAAEAAETKEGRNGS